MAFENFKMEESFNRFQRKWLVAGMVQCRERSPPTVVACIRFLDVAFHVG